MPRIITNLRFDTEALDAAEYYCSIFPSSEITRVAQYSDAGRAGTVVTVDFHLDGEPTTDTTTDTTNTTNTPVS